MHFNSFLILTSLSKLQCRVDGVFYLTETISLHWNIFLKFIYIAIQFGYTFVDLCTWRQKPKPHISEFRHFNKQYSIMKSKKYFSIGSKGSYLYFFTGPQFFKLFIREGTGMTICKKYIRIWRRLSDKKSHLSPFPRYAGIEEP